MKLPRDRLEMRLTAETEALIAQGKAYILATTGAKVSDAEFIRLCMRSYIQSRIGPAAAPADKSAGHGSALSRSKPRGRDHGTALSA